MTEPGFDSSSTNSNASRSDWRIASGEIVTSTVVRWLSWSLTAKCFIVDTTWRAWMPLMRPAAMRPASSGSSPTYSKLRPLRGSRARFAPPARNVLKPEARASSAIMRPPASETAGSKLAAVASEDGSAVRSMPPTRTPIDASVCHCGGMPRRAMPGT